MAVTTQILQDGAQIAVMKFHWDTGSSETNVVKVNVSALTAHPTQKTECTEVAIERVWYATDASTTVDIIWNATANITALSITGDGYQDFRSVGPIWNNAAAAGNDGDILFSTIGTPAATSRYTITLAMRKKYS